MATMYIYLSGKYSSSIPWGRGGKGSGTGVIAFQSGEAGELGTL